MGFATQAWAGPPADRWNLDVSLGKCTLSRTFTTPEATLSVKTDVGTDEYKIGLADARTARLRSGAPFEAAIKVDGKTKATSFVSVETGDAPLGKQIWADVRPFVIDAIAGGSQLSITDAGVSVASAPLPQARQAIAALRKCEKDQLVEWGADPAQFAPGGTAPWVGERRELVPQAVLSTVHYPGVPIQPQHYVILSDTGVVERCAAVFGIPDSDLEQIVCKSLMGRKIGDPARDASGKPVRSVVAFTPARIRRASF